MSYQLIRGDATSIPLADDSVDLIVTSPPYFALRSYTDGGEHYDGQIGSEPTPQAFLEALWAVTAECRRVLKPSGSMFVNLGDKYAGSGGNNQSGVGEKAQKAGPSSYNRNSDVVPEFKTGARDGHRRSRPSAVKGIPAKSLMMLPQRYAIGCIDQLGLIARAEIIWAKPNGLPESVTDRVRRSHEQWFHMTKEPRYFSAVDEVREPQTGNDAKSRPEFQTHDSNAGDRHRSLRRDPELFNPLGKLPGSVWTIPTEPLRVPDHLGVDHFAAFPSEWPRRLILGWSPSGVCVACGEGRRPVVDKKPMEWRESPTIAGRTAPGASRKPMSGTMLSAAEATITGYACACPDTTAPTRPAVVLDPFSGTGTTTAVAHALGRHGVGIDLSADYLRLAEWRINHSGLVSKIRDDYLTKGGAAAAEAVMGADDEAAVPTVLDFG